jgi:hypothetical protein
MAHYIFNLVGGDAPRERAAEYLRAGRWNVDADEPHRGALAAGDLVLLYLGAPDRMFIGRAELASAVESDGVLLAHVEEWDPPVPMSAVLSQIDRSQNARADFETGVVRITATEYETALAVAAARQ